MEVNLFEKIQNRRLLMKNLAGVALKNEWINLDTHNDIIEKVANDTLTIGVIGQMKCGKSTFLNAFLFENEVLPAATTPMTAALSVITYGEKESIEVEFYTTSEWDEMLAQANRNLSDAMGDKALESKIKAAKELVAKASCLGNGLTSLLNTKKKDDFCNLHKYVGADGNYVAITKLVKIYYPKEWLKGVEIVDTPGFNDPVVSREERTQEFLKKADVVLMLLYAGRAFDATDRDIVFEKIRSVGVGKLLIGINKYDLCYEQGETMEEIKGNVVSEVRKACREYRDPTISELLIDLEPIPFSANMALMAKIPMNEVQADENLSFHWKKSCDTFEIFTQKQMLKESLIGNLESAIQEIVGKSKVEILFRKPVNMIFQAGMNIKMQVESALNEKKLLYDALSMPDDELQERINGLSKAQKRIERKTARAIEELKEEYDDEVDKIITKLENLVETAQKEIDTIIDTSKKDSAKHQVQVRWEKLVEKELQREMGKTQKKLRNLLKDKSHDLGLEIEEIIRKYVEEPDELIDSFRDAIYIGLLNVGKQENHDVNGEEKVDSDDFSWTDLFWLPVLPIVGSIVIWDNRMHWRVNLREEMKNRLHEVDFCKFREDCLTNKPGYIAFMRVTVVNEILSSLISQLERLQNDKYKKENEREKLEVEISELKSNSKNIALQISEMQKLKSEIILK